MAIPLQKREYFECKYSNQLQPVSCIASFSNHGGVRPQYIKVTDPEGKNDRIVFPAENRSVVYQGKIKKVRK